MSLLILLEILIRFSISKPSYIIMFYEMDCKHLQTILYYYVPWNGQLAAYFQVTLHVNAEIQPNP